LREEARLDEQLELVAIVYRQDELAMIRSRLEWAGIWSFRHSELQIAIEVPITLGLGGVRIYVHREEAGDARAVLAEGGPWDRIGGVYDNSPWADWIMMLMLLFLAATPPPARIPSVIVGAAAAVRSED